MKTKVAILTSFLFVVVLLVYKVNSPGLHPGIARTSIEVGKSIK